MSDLIAGYRQGAADRAAGRPPAALEGVTAAFAEGYRKGWERTGPPATSHTDQETDDELLAGMRDGAWLDAQQFPPLRYAVPGLIPEGSSMLVGPPKIGKSWFVLDLALSLAAGGRALGAIPVGDPRRVFYLALEDGDRRMQDRCRRLLGTGPDGTPVPIPPLFTYQVRILPGRIIDTVAAWLRRYGDDGAPLVIIDTLGKVMPPALQGESAYQRDYRVGSALKRLCDEYPGTSLLVNHHDRKAVSSDFVDSVSGTHGLAGAADTILVITRDRSEEKALLQVTGRDVPEREYALRFTNGSAWVLEGGDLEKSAELGRAARITAHATAGVGDRMAEIIAFVTGRSEPTRAKDVADHFGINENSARTYLGRAADAGRIERTGRGAYIGVASVASVAFPGSPSSDASSERNTSQHPAVAFLRAVGPGNMRERNTRDTRNTPLEACRVCGDPIDPAAGDVHPTCTP